MKKVQKAHSNYLCMCKGSNGRRHTPGSLHDLLSASQVCKAAVVAAPAEAVPPGSPLALATPAELYGQHAVDDVHSLSASPFTGETK